MSEIKSKISDPSMDLNANFCRAEQMFTGL